MHVWQAIKASNDYTYIENHIGIFNSGTLIFLRLGAYFPFPVMD